MKTATLIKLQNRLGFYRKNEAFGKMLGLDKRTISRYRAGAKIPLTVSKLLTCIYHQYSQNKKAPGASY